MTEDTSIVVVSVDDVKTFEKLKLISQIAPLKERIRSFERKYEGGLDSFESKTKKLPEDFERWDDFIEWKAYNDSLKDLESKLKKIEDATDFRIAPR
jgi:hypothetical protein